MHIRRDLGYWLWCAVWLFASACQPDPPQLGSHAYERQSLDCEPETHPGLAGVWDDERSATGIRYSIRTPANYDPRIAHPLLMVYAPAGLNRFGSESLTGLTTAATRAGFMIAYASHRRLSLDVIEELGTIPGLIAEKWCVDPDRIFFDRSLRRGDGGGRPGRPGTHAAPPGRNRAERGRIHGPGLGRLCLSGSAVGDGHAWRRGSTFPRLWPTDCRLVGDL